MCLGISCADVGGLWSTGTDSYLEGASPCVSGDLITTQYQAVASYVPGSNVVDHNAMDLDQAALEAALPDWSAAKKIYTQGGSSKAYAQFTVNALSASISKGAQIVGVTAAGKTVSGFAYAAASAGDTTLKVGYTVSSVAKDGGYGTECHVGGLQTTVTSGCFKAAGTLTVTDPSITVTTTAVTNKAGRTLQGFSLQAKAKMYDCANCPYVTYKKFYDYYGDFDYADKWVTAALDGTKADFATSGDADFAAVSDDSTRKECVKKGTAYMSVWMYVVREFEDAIDDCKVDAIDRNYGSVHAWDEGVAFYAGSKEGTEGASLTGSIANSATGPSYSPGKLVYALAEKRCMNFKTCGADGKSTSGGSFVNHQLMVLFANGRDRLQNSQCSSVRPILTRIIHYMTVPLVQGTLRYAWKVDPSTDGSKTTKEKAEGAVFAAAVLPLVASCDAGSAKTIYDNMKVGASSTTYSDVRAAFEANYICLGISCADVGALYDGTYVGGDPCMDESLIVQAGSTAAAFVNDDDDNDQLPAWGIAVIVILAVLVLVVGIMVCVMVRGEKQGKPVFTAVKQPEIPSA